ncbi:MAG: hypothetical protein KF718_32380 [Polyangiaceae bacterium]|nr:hypothetical protein [Polyangiaceae bacterium]
MSSESVPQAIPRVDNHWNWGMPLTIDCDELITTWGVRFGNFHIRRVRLDSLGPGTPPD